MNVFEMPLSDVISVYDDNCNVDNALEHLIDECAIFNGLTRNGYRSLINDVMELSAFDALEYMDIHGGFWYLKFMNALEYIEESIYGGVQCLS